MSYSTPPPFAAQPYCVCQFGEGLKVSIFFGGFYNTPIYSCREETRVPQAQDTQMRSSSGHNETRVFISRIEQ